MVKGGLWMVVWQGEERMAFEEERNGFENLSTSFRQEAAELWPVHVTVPVWQQVGLIRSTFRENTLWLLWSSANFVGADYPVAPAALFRELRLLGNLQHELAHAIAVFAASLMAWLLFN